MDDGQKGFGHPSRVGVLDNVPAIDNSRGPLSNDLFRALEYLQIVCLSAAADQQWNPGGLNNPVILLRVLSRISLDHIRSELYRLPPQGKDFPNVAIHHVAAGFGVGPEDQRFNHQWEIEPIAFRF